MELVRALGLASVLLVTGCYDLLTPEPKNKVRWDAKNVGGYVETARGEPDVVYGWEFGLHGELARWRECTVPKECSRIERERRAEDVLAIEHVGQGALPDGTAVDVVKLSVTPRRKYMLPPP